MTRLPCHACNTTPEACDDDYTGRGYGCCLTCDARNGNTHRPDDCHRELAGGVCQTCGVVVGAT